MAKTPAGNVITTATNVVTNVGQQTVNTTLNTANTVVGIGGGAVGGVINGALGQATAPIVDIAKKGKQVYDLIQNPSLGGALSLLGRGFPPYRNELDQFASYNYVFTLGALTNLELNYPLSYRTVGPLIKIIKSGGTAGNKVPTIYELDGNVEYFIEDVEIQNHLAPNPGTRLSNATVIDFKVIEPYSMGQFFHSLRTAALVAGHPNYLQAPFLLSVSFIGYDDEGNVKEPFFSKRHIPIKLVQSDMDVTESGAVYDVKAVPYNESALTNEVDSVKTDMVIKGRTVSEVLQSGAESLASKLNLMQTAQVNAKQKNAQDYYIISFPNDGVLDSIMPGIAGATASATTSKHQELYESISGSGAEIPDNFQDRLNELPGSTSLESAFANQLKSAAEASVNSIGSLDINLADVPAAAQQYVNPADAESDEIAGQINQGDVVTGNDTETFTFSSETPITSIIEEVVLSSNWGRNALKQRENGKGEYEWFKIHTHVYNSSSLFSGLVTGASPKIYVYRVVPYTVPASIFGGPFSSKFWNGLAAQSGAIKAYNYIYTGQNSDIIKFDLHFNQTFYTGVQATRSQQMQSQIFGSQFSPQERPESDPANTMYSNDAQASLVAGSETGESRILDTAKNFLFGGGGGNNDASTSTAKTWNDNLIHSNNDMITVDLEINGDPYWLMDAGLGNYLGIKNPLNSAITIEGSANPVNGTITTVLNFRTPIDYDGKDGFVKYPLGGFLPLAMFSGVYRTIYVTNTFKSGRFTQKLNLARLPSQDLSPTAIAGALVSAFKGSEAGKAIGIGTEENKTGDNQGAVNS